MPSAFTLLTRHATEASKVMCAAEFAVFHAVVAEALAKVLALSAKVVSPRESLRRHGQQTRLVPNAVRVRGEGLGVRG